MVEVYPMGYKLPDMCRAVSCKQCGKTTWAGCGMHVDQVMAHVPEAERCQGHAREASIAKRRFGFLSRG
jgi:hypothetical protein